MTDEREKLSRLLGLDEVLKIVPVSEATLLRMEAEGTFPRSLFISANRRVWRETDLLEWQRNLPANKRFNVVKRPQPSSPVVKPEKR